MEGGFCRSAAVGDRESSPSRGLPALTLRAETPRTWLVRPQRRLRVAPIALLVVGSLLFAMAGCAGSPGQGSGPAAAKVQNMAVGLSLDEESRVVDPTEVFRPDPSAIRLSFDLGDVTREVNVDIQWTYAAGGELLKGVSEKVSGDKHMTASLNRPHQGNFPEGDYRVAVLIDGVEGGGIMFSVQAPEAGESEMRVQNVVTGTGLDSDQRIQQPTTAFKPDAAGISLSAEVVNVTGDAEVSVQWVYIPTNEVLNGPTQKASGDTRVGFSLNRPPDRNWATGHYKVVVYVNGKVAGGSAFTIYP